MKRFYHIFALCFCISAVGCGCAKPATDDGQNGKPYIKLGTSEKLVTNASGSFEVYVESNTSWTVEPQAEWLSVSISNGNGNRNVTIRYEANTAAGTDGEIQDRQGTVRFAAEGTIPTRITVKQGRRTFKNPVFMPMPDPYIWREDNGNGSAVYYPCKSGGNGINLGKTYKLTEWGGISSVWKCPTSSTAWNRANLWAPEMHRIDGVWYIYYAAGWPSSESKAQYGSDYMTQRTGVLRNTNEDPTQGNWEDMGQLLTGGDDDLEYYLENGFDNGKVDADHNIYAIDMTVFELDDQLYAVWSGNISKTDGNQRLYIAKMENPYTIKQARIEIGRPTESWELNNRNLLEGPAMLFNPDRTKLFCVYSCNGSWTKHYKLGWLELDLTNPGTRDPLVPENWKKSSNYVFYRCDNVSKSSNPYAEDDAKNEAYMRIGGVHGVGHNTFTKSPDGTEDWIVYHVKRYVEDGWDNRDAFIQKFTWDKSGYPVFGEPVGWQEEIEVPSGEPL